MNKTQQKRVEWTLRIALAGMFIGHGAFALLGKQGFKDMITLTIGIGEPNVTTLLTTIGIVDTLVGITMLVVPVRILLAGGAAWAFLTALARPWSVAEKAAAAGGSYWGAFFGADFLDLIERFANIGAPLALLWLRGIPTTLKDWFR